MSDDKQPEPTGLSHLVPGFEQGTQETPSMMDKQYTDRIIEAQKDQK